MEEAYDDGILGHWCLLYLVNPGEHIQEHLGRGSNSVTFRPS